MSDIENIEIRVLIFGEKSVGKRSMIKRFKILNSTQTINEMKPNSKEAAHKTSRLREISKPIDSFYSKKYNTKEKKKLLELISFTKIISVSNYNIHLNFYPISAADPVGVVDEVKEEEEDMIIEKSHRIKFDNIKDEVQRIFLKSPKHFHSDVRYLFLFMFDLNNYSTFEKIRLYYSELNKYYNINHNYFKVLIGNKVDTKIPFVDDHKISLENFILENKFFYYEVSTKMFFNFEKFFEQMYFDVFESIRPDFSTSYFKERFTNVMTLRPSFPRAERTSIQVNDVPGPQKYNSNVYDMGENVSEAFKGGKKFSTKIFLNKQGPVFDHKKTDYAKLHKKEENKSKKSKSMQKDKNAYESQPFLNRKENSNQFREPGFSIGIRKPVLNLKKKRKEEFLKKANELNQAYDIENITTAVYNTNNVRPAEYFDKASSKRKEYLENKINTWKEKYSKYNQLRTKNESDQVKKIEEEKRNTFINKSFDDNSLSEFEFDRRKTRLQSIAERPKPKRAKSHRVIKKEPYIVPGPDAYDVRGKYVLDGKKGFSFGGKYNYNPMKNNPVPPFYTLQSDIDKMLQNPKFAYKSYAPRFKEHNVYIPDATRDKSKNRWQRWEVNKFGSEHYQNIQDFTEFREKYKMAHQENLEKKKYDDEEKKEAKKRKRLIRYGIKRDDDEENLIRDINYNLVEYCSPKFTMKGRHDKGVFSQHEVFDDSSKIQGLENSVSQISQKVTRNLYPLPNYNVVKPDLPAFSFSKAERFDFKLPDKEDHKVLEFENGVYGQEDRKSFTKGEYFMGRAKKESKLKYSEVPGPGNYKIKGFAETLVDEIAKRKKNYKERKEAPCTLSKYHSQEEGVHHDRERNLDFDNSLDFNKEDSEN